MLNSYLSLPVEQFNAWVLRYENKNTRHFYSFNYRRYGVDRESPALVLYASEYSQRTFPLSQASQRRTFELLGVYVCSAKTEATRGARERLVACFKFLLFFGMRICEASRFRFDLNSDKEQQFVGRCDDADEPIYIFNVISAKSKSARRDVLVPVSLFNEFVAHGWSIKNQQIKNDFTRFNQYFNLRGRERVSCHVLRRTFASNRELLGNSSDLVSKALGNTPTTCSKYYMKSLDLQLREQIKMLGELSYVYKRELKN